jgi:hypothetical protein
MTPTATDLEVKPEIPVAFRRKGNQIPTLHIHKENGNSLYDTQPIIAKDIDSWVSKPFPWQKLVYRDIFTIKEDGSLQYKTICLSVPRRNGKTEIILGVMLIFAIIMKAKVLYTAQIQDTADDIYARFMDLVQDPSSRLHLYFPGIQRKSKVNEEVVQAYDPKNPARMLGTLEFRGRRGDKGRGITRDVLIIDEAQDYDSGEEQRFGSINGSSELGLTFLVGTPPPLDSVTDGMVFRQLRDEAIADKDLEWEKRSKRGTAWIEWGADSVKEKNDRDAWYMYNPSMGWLPRNALSEEWFENRPSSTEVFSVENLGYWTSQTKDRAIEISSFTSLKVTGEELKDGLEGAKYAVAIKEDWLAESLYIGVAFRRPDGKIAYLHAQTINMRKPESDERLKKMLSDLIKPNRCVSVVIDGTFAKSVVIPVLTSIGLWQGRANKSKIRQGKISMASYTDVSLACSSLLTGIASKKLVHSNQPPVESAVKDAKKRKIGENGFGFVGASGKIDTNPLEVCALAFHAVETKAQIKGGDMTIDTTRLQSALGVL